MTSDWSKPTRYIVGVGLALLGIFILYLARSVVPLLIIAALIAVLLRPLILWLQRGPHLSRGLAVALVYLAGLMLIPLLLALLIPAIVNAVTFVATLNYPSILDSVLQWFRATLIALKEMPIPVVRLNQFVDQTVDTILAGMNQESAVTLPALPSVTTILQSLGTALTTTFRTAAGVVGSLFSQITLLLFIVLSSIYISLSAHTYHDGFMRAVPQRFKTEITILIARIERLWGAFFRGQLTLMLVIGVFSWLGLTILGVPGAIYLGIVAGLLELIPNLGPIIATIPAVIVALLEGSVYLPVGHWMLALLVVLLYVLVQQLENNLIVPRVLGEAVELPPLVVMTGVLVGVTVAGLLGALLATPVIATGRELVRYAYRKILGEEPFPPVEPAPKPPSHPFEGLRRWVKKANPFRKPSPREILPEAEAPLEQHN
ncbi:AI-2E family transporter [bacterium]|nr:MAG: AI-2E family transporter [bacterium]